jgi:hypothetical protein
LRKTRGVKAVKAVAIIIGGCFMFATAMSSAPYRYNDSLIYTEVYGYPNGRRYMYDQNVLNVPIGPSVPGLGDAEAALMLPTPRDSFNTAAWGQEKLYSDFGRYLDTNMHWHPEWQGARNAYKKFLVHVWSPFLADWIQVYGANLELTPEAISTFATRLKNEVWPAAERAGAPVATQVGNTKVWVGLGDGGSIATLAEKKMAKTAVVAAVGIIAVGLTLMLSGQQMSKKHAR